MPRSTRNIVLGLVGSAALMGCCLTSCINVRDEPVRDANGNVVRHHRRYHFSPWFFGPGLFGRGGYGRSYSPSYSPSYGRSGGGSTGGKSTSGTTSRGGFGSSGHASGG